MVRVEAIGVLRWIVSADSQNPITWTEAPTPKGLIYQMIIQDEQRGN